MILSPHKYRLKVLQNKLVFIQGILTVGEGLVQFQFENIASHKLHHLINGKVCYQKYWQYYTVTLPSLLAPASMGSVTRRKLILFVSRHPRWPRRVEYYITMSKFCHRLFDK